MHPLQYTSEEMFSSTELIRKSKMVFDKLHKNEIEKAVILRDGKPSFMMLEFSNYEKIMKEYLSLKQMNNNKAVKTSEKIQVINEVKETKINEEDSELSEKELLDALEQIDSLNMDDLNNDEKSEKDKKEGLKDFWE